MSDLHRHIPMELPPLPPPGLDHDLHTFLSPRSVGIWIETAHKSLRVRTLLSFPFLRQQAKRRHLKRQPPKDQPKMSEDGRKLYVGGLSWKYTDDDLRALCEKFGNIEDGKNSIAKVSSGQGTFHLISVHPGRKIFQF